MRNSVHILLSEIAMLVDNECIVCIQYFIDFIAKITNAIVQIRTRILDNDAHDYHK